MSPPPARNPNSYLNPSQPNNNSAASSASFQSSKTSSAASSAVPFNQQQHPQVFHSQHPNPMSYNGASNAAQNNAPGLFPQGHHPQQFSIYQQPSREMANHPYPNPQFTSQIVCPTNPPIHNAQYQQILAAHMHHQQMQMGAFPRAHYGHMQINPHTGQPLLMQHLTQQQQQLQMFQAQVHNSRAQMNAHMHPVAHHPNYPMPHQMTAVNAQDSGQNQVQMHYQPFHTQNPNSSANSMNPTAPVYQHHQQQQQQQQQQATNVSIASSASSNHPENVASQHQNHYNSSTRSIAGSAASNASGYTDVASSASGSEVSMPPPVSTPSSSVAAVSVKPRMKIVIKDNISQEEIDLAKIVPQQVGTTEEVTEEETCESLDRKGVCSSCEEPIEDVKDLFRCRTCVSEPTTFNASSVPSFCHHCVVAHIRKRHQVSDYKGHEIIMCDKHRLGCDTFCDNCQTLMCSECCKGHPGDHEVVSVESKAVEIRKKIHETISQNDADYKPLARAADNMRVDKEKFEKFGKSMTKERLVENLHKIMKEALQGAIDRCEDEFEALQASLDDRTASISESEMKLKNALTEIDNSQISARTKLSLSDGYLIRSFSGQGGSAGLLRTDESIQYPNLTQRYIDESTARAVKFEQVLEQSLTPLIGQYLQEIRPENFKFSSVDTHNSLNALEVIGDFKWGIRGFVSTNSVQCIASETSETSFPLKFMSEDGKTIEQANCEINKGSRFYYLLSTQQFVIVRNFDRTIRQIFKVEDEKVSVAGLDPSKFGGEPDGVVEIDGELHSYSLDYGDRRLIIQPEHPMFHLLLYPPHNIVSKLFHFDMGLVAVCFDIKSDNTKIWLYPPVQDSVERPPRLLFTLSKPCVNKLKMFDGTGFITVVFWSKKDKAIHYERYNTQTEVVDVQKTVTFNISEEISQMTVTKDSCYLLTKSGVLLKCKDLLKKLNDML